MSEAIADGAILLRDDFSKNGAIDSSLWKSHGWKYEGDGSFYGLTQQREALPQALNGFMRLQLDTYNPTGDANNPTTFVGSEAISNQKFELSEGMAFEFSGRFAQDQRGIVAGMFTFGGTGDARNELDFEALSNKPNSIQTNIFENERTATAGRAKHHDVSGSLSELHTYRIEWHPNTVRWLIDGVVVREVEAHKLIEYQKPMAVHMNIWAPEPGWGEAYDPSLVAVGHEGGNRKYFFDVDYAQVSKLSILQGAGGNDTLFGTAANDAIYGNLGDDVLVGGAGDDLLVGGAGIDAASYDMVAADASITRKEDGSVSVSSASHGNDTLKGIELLRFSDQVILVNKPQTLGPDLFDTDFYLTMNPDVAAALEAFPMATARDHFALWGAGEGRDPNVLFDEDWYLSHNPDVAAAVHSGLITSGYQHYQLHGWREDRDPSRWFDTSAYREANPEVDAAGMGPLAHYLMIGAEQGLRIVGVPDEAEMALA